MNALMVLLWMDLKMGGKPFNRYKVVKNCNCVIENSSKDIPISNKHQAIVFYQGDVPVRLAVLDENTEVEKCIDIALNQYFEDTVLRDVYKQFGVQSSFVDMGEKPIYNQFLGKEEIDVGSCDRWPLLYNMLQGLYTETNNAYGNFSSDKYYFLPDLHIKYTLITDTECFKIEHNCAFMNTTKTRIVPIQENSPLTMNQKI